MRPALSRLCSLCHHHSYVTSLIAGMVATLALPPLYVMPAFLAFGWVFYAAAQAKRWQDALRHITLGAYGWFLVSLYWISHSLLVGEADYWFLLPLSFFGIPIIVTLFWMIGGLLGYLLARTPQARLILIACLIGASEWGREFIATGFPWNAPGLIMLGSQPTASLAAYFGQTGLNIITLFMATIIPFFIMARRHVTDRIWYRRYDYQMMLSIIIIGVIGLTGLAYHHDKITPITARDESVGIRVVQPAVPQGDKWVFEKRDTHMKRLSSLSQAPISRPIDLVIWPETAFAGDYGFEPQIVDKAATAMAYYHQNHAKPEISAFGQLLTGVLRFDEMRKLRNSALLIDVEGAKTLYDKTHLVPFGEYVPWRFIPFVDAIAGPIDFSAGSKVRPLFLPSIGLVQPLICYEAIFPALLGKAEERADLLVNITNDGWFGHTAGPYQHLAQTRMTAISYGIALIRVANSGISAAYDGKGSEIASLGLGRAGYFDMAKPAIYAPSIFARFGWLISLALLIVLGAVSIGLDRGYEKRH